MLLVLTGTVLLLTGCESQQNVLNPQGPVGKSEMDLIYWSIALMTIVVLAVFSIFTFVLIKYRSRPEGNPDYQPEMKDNKKLEIIYTAIPVIIVILLAVPTVRTTFALKNPPANDPITIDVTSSDWKWIFSYPQQGIETVNYVDIPVNHPVDFELHDIGPLNSFWVPALGGQEMSMPGMSMSLWLEATHNGDFIGRSANFSGAGFTNMTFHVYAKQESDFSAWVKQVKATAAPMTPADWQSLMKPGNVGTMQFSTIYKGSTNTSASMTMTGTKSNSTSMGGGQ